VCLWASHGGLLLYERYTPPYIPIQQIIPWSQIISAPLVAVAAVSFINGWLQTRLLQRGGQVVSVIAVVLIVAVLQSRHGLVAAAVNGSLALIPAIFRARWNSLYVGMIAVGVGRLYRDLFCSLPCLESK